MVLQARLRYICVQFLGNSELAQALAGISRGMKKQPTITALQLSCKSDFEWIGRTGAAAAKQEGRGNTVQ